MAANGGRAARGRGGAALTCHGGLLEPLSSFKAHFRSGVQGGAFHGLTQSLEHPDAKGTHYRAEGWSDSVRSGRELVSDMPPGHGPAHLRSG